MHGQRSLLCVTFPRGILFRCLSSVSRPLLRTAWDTGAGLGSRGRPGRGQPRRFLREVGTVGDRDPAAAVRYRCTSYRQAPRQQEGDSQKARKRLPLLERVVHLCVCPLQIRAGQHQSPP